MMPFSQYLINQFNEKADVSDKIRNLVLTLISTGGFSILLVEGMVSFFSIKGVIIPSFLMMIISTWSFNLFRLWYICRTFVKGEKDTPDES